MATHGTGPGPGPGYRSGNKMSWAQKVAGSLPSSWNKNILEIVLEKDDRGAFNVSEIDCFHLLTKLGIDPRQGAMVESVQICPSGKGFILVTFKQGIALDHYSRYDVLEVTRTGIRAVHVKPAGKRDVVVTIKGLHPNTRDDGVINYLSKYGKVVSTKVVYGTFGEGPLKGVKNGDRSYKMEIKAEVNIGTYHAIDSQKVTLRYKGQLQTCARCFQTAVDCKGGAIARKCEAAQGAKVEFSDFILKLWQDIGYVPGEIEMAAVYDEQAEYDEAAQTAEEKVVFTPEKQVSEPEKFSGVSIKNFPRDMDNGKIIEFLIKAGMPENFRDTAEIKNNGSVALKNLDNAVCLDMIANIHNKFEFGRRLFCNGFIALTPEKADLSEEVIPDQVPKQPLIVSPPETQILPASPSLVVSIPAVEGSVSTSSRLSLPGLSSNDFSSGSELVRRYSLSLKDRPPACSLAADILSTRQSLLSEMRELTDQLSEFGSCVSDISGDEVDGDEKNKPAKRKASRTPIKSDEKLKKAALVTDWYDRVVEELDN